MNRRDARRPAGALCDELWPGSSEGLLTRPADRGGISVGLNPPDETEDEELEDLVWRDLPRADLADAATDSAAR